ncbi:MAG: hypothetical protein IKA10_02155 [Oscillospiraceae bacterium]|nr:hypothetical protein [Oscillospiraceae bacterium]
MFTDILFIVTTAFALFGIYCFAETVYEIFSVSAFPPSVTVIAAENEELAYRKIKYIEENVPNNHTVIYRDQSKENSADEAVLLNQMIKDVLYVNNK